ncbi:alkene reductase [Streptomyces sp. NBC_00620]|uniref:alkene reductase n=1 Tax=unclassified Streptomyces TaxID=2593676 RepID=UPI002250859E|nr:alkene reductase [Streptomyces sp. NBC_00620]MCX4974928.1 alkene reductase [Streptomyces sp. NBC_00620]WUC10869.1 alkene reductase [Streptomyces sp. NBC_00564]
MTTAFDPIELSGTRLANRIAMAPMTRSRAFGEGLTVTESTVEYYSQRASAGLIVTEGIQPSVQGQGYPNTPGLHTDEQVAAWRKVTDAVHAKGARIFAQIMHAGRIGHPVLWPGEERVSVAPSSVAPDGQLYTQEGPKDFIAPRELDAGEIPAVIEEFVDAARNAVAAGFDGVELHGANGYLIHQFIADNTNLRTDEWGGSVENRIRFAVEVTKAVSAAIGPERTGLRISPGNPYNDIAETDPKATYPALVEALEPLGLGYLHIVEMTPGYRDITLELRELFSGTFILNPATEGPTDHKALGLVEDGVADILAFGALFLANPDLPVRLKSEGPYNAPDPASFFGGDDKGYTDYPTLGES